MRRTTIGHLVVLVCCFVMLIVMDFRLCCTKSRLLLCAITIDVAPYCNGGIHGVSIVLDKFTEPLCGPATVHLILTKMRKSPHDTDHIESKHM